MVHSARPAAGLREGGGEREGAIQSGGGGQAVAESPLFLPVVEFSLLPTRSPYCNVPVQ